MTIGDRSRDESTGSTAEEHGRHRKTRGCRSGSEGERQRVDGSIDDAAVEAEEEAANGRDRAQCHDVSRAVGCGLERRRRAGGAQFAAGYVSLGSWYQFIHG